MMPNLNDLMSFKPVVAPDEPTALYARLSVDDANDGDSNSIVHQELICKGLFLPPNTYDCGSFVVN